MKILFIGGTGTISSAITRSLVNKGEDVWLINRGIKSNEFDGKVKQITADINDEKAIAEKISGEYWRWGMSWQYLWAYISDGSAGCVWSFQLPVWHR